MWQNPLNPSKGIATKTWGKYHTIYLPLSLRRSPFGQHICATVGFPPHMLSASLPLLVKEPPAAIQNQNRKLQQDNQPMWSTIWQLEENQSEEEPVAGPCSTPSIRPPLFPKVLPLCYIFERPRFKENPHSHVPVCDRAKPPTPAEAGLPMELPSVLMVMNGNGPGHHRIHMLVSVGEVGTESKLRKSEGDW